MTQTICRMYPNPARASEAADALRHRGPDIHFDEVYVVSSHDAPSSEAGTPPSTDEIVVALTRIRVLRAHAVAYAEGIRRGGGLVTVHAPFGTASTAINVLQEFGPIDSGIDEDRGQARGYDEAAPLSSVFSLPLLVDEPAPFSRFWNLPVLSRRGAATSSRPGGAEPARSSAPYRPTVPMPLLSRNPAPLSSMLGLPLLSRSAAPLSSRLGLPLLTRRDR